jgi:hypothetical protein
VIVFDFAILAVTTLECDFSCPSLTKSDRWTQIVFLAKTRLSTNVSPGLIGAH